VSARPVTALFLLAAIAVVTAADSPAWKRHTIDDSSRGADGVRLADVNADGLPDITTGWEEGGAVRVYLNPGAARAKERWPAVTVGAVGSVEDAVLADLDGDGAVEVVSSCEGRVKAMFVHWAPREKARYLDPAAWKTEALPAARGAQQWMFCLPLQVDGARGVDLVAGGKGKGAAIGWFESPPDPRTLADWKWHRLCAAGWVMSLVAADMDSDGDLDVLATDRKGPARGCFWLENPAPRAPPTAPWPRHNIGGDGREVMFLTLADLDGDGMKDVLVAAKPREILFLRRLARDGLKWEERAIPLPATAGTAKAVAAGDVNLDGRPDLVFTCEDARDGKSGVMWLAFRQSALDPDWEARELGGADGLKHDLVELLDLDGDGDLDALTCEEARGLGVFWYENPARSRR
jgi:hypothetical protein